MAQESVAQDTTHIAHNNADAHASETSMLGPLLCWAVVFADIGTSVYYTPGILYGTVGKLAGFFVFLTLFVFVLLTLKYTEVTHRFPQGGGVVTVAAQAINSWFGALGGMFILVDYFLTAAISSLSGILYLSVVIPAITPTIALFITIGVLILLGLLNWIGISESARVSLIGAIIAFISDIAILITVFSHISLTEFFSLISTMFSGHDMTPVSLLSGFAGAFLAFSGLESISQLSPVMKRPHKKVAGLAMLLVVITIGLTSPLLTIFSTLLLPGAAANSVQSAQLISLLAGKWGGPILETEVAISASALLVFASNTAIIGAYHVFMALSRMQFLPTVILERNKLRGTPHFSIVLATGIPIVILLIVWGNINILGDMYAFGLLGAFTLTCLGLDIVRYRDLRRAQAIKHAQRQTNIAFNGEEQATNVHDLLKSNTHIPASSGHQAEITETAEAMKLWYKINFVLGIITTILVATAWSTNLVTKPLATGFGGTVTVIGMGVAFFIHTRYQKEGKVPVPVVVTRLEDVYPNATLAVLSAGDKHNEAVIRAAINNADVNRPLLFLYLAENRPRQIAPRMMEIIDPYLEDQQAKENFGRAESLALKAKVPMRKYVYLQNKPDIVSQIWQTIHPRDTLVSAKHNEQVKDINPDRIRYELTPEGKVAHLLKHW
ncbi:MAG TPA: APC family permease [Dictyobacter sp.]|jgi:amino acid transporter|nr:APC family permease [Dictyobacter sp.]